MPAKGRRDMHGPLSILEYAFLGAMHRMQRHFSHLVRVSLKTFLKNSSIS